MMLRALNPNGPLRVALAIVLAFSVSVCCCQAEFLVHAFDRHATVPTCGDSGGAACCSGRAESAPADDAPPPPGQGCQACCIKGVGPKDIAPVLDVPAWPATLFAALPVVVAPRRRRRARVRPSGRARRDVEPQSLLRQHCALIV